MKTLIKNPAVIYTADTKGRNYKRGSEMNDLSPLYEHSILIEDEQIKDFIPAASSEKIIADETVDVKDKLLLPGFIEGHTHLVFAGSRANEFKMKLKGASYEEIARAGGGIMNTVKAVRSSSLDELFRLALPRVNNFIAQGVTTIEIKSGYGLDFDNEIKILETVKRLDNAVKADLVPSFLGAHTIPSEYKNNREDYIELIINKLLPYISGNKLARFCDAFCESTAFLPEETERIFIKAKALGLGLKLHTDQFNSIGGIDSALALNVSSIDHLEVIPDKYLRSLSKSEIVCTLLPGVSFFLNYQFAPARKLIDNNAVVSLASDYNPGSSNINNIFMIMSLAAMKMNMSIQEIISAYTINAAKALDISTFTGSLEIGKKADIAVIDAADINEIIYNIGQNFNYHTIKNGKTIWKKGEQI